MKKFIPTFLFALFILGIFLVDVFTPPKEFSDMENRVLKTPPTPTIATIVDNSFTTDYNSYLNDQFLLRSEWITLKSIGESIMLKTENNGVVYGKNHYMFDKTITIDESRLNKNLSYILEFGETYPKENIYFTVVPSSYSILSDYLPHGLLLPNQLKYSEKIYSELKGSNIKTIDLTNTLINHKTDYIYYRTDHHWTTLGAYLAYENFAVASGGKLEPLSKFKENKVADFYGTYYSKAKSFATVPDVISYYDIDGSVSIAGSPNTDDEEKDSLYDLAQFEKRDKYAGFIYSNNGISILNNPTRSADKKDRILVIKDSYANSMVPFLLSNYNSVYVVDLRYTDSIESLLSPDFSDIKFDDIYIIYSFPNFTTDSNIIKILPE